MVTRSLQPRGSPSSNSHERRFDLVVASYVIGEARSPSERRRLVDRLWRRTGGMLVLVEPGTPVGSANVREARAQARTTLLPVGGLPQLPDC